MDSEPLPTPAMPGPQAGPVRRDHPAPQGWGLWWRWMVANAAFGVAFGLLLRLGADDLIQSFFSNLSSRLPYSCKSVLAIAFAFLLYGIPLGFAQAFALRKHLRGMVGWVVATTVGPVIGPEIAGRLAEAMRLTEHDSGITYHATVALIVGLVWATPQYVVLRKHCRRAVWWIPIFPLCCMSFCLTQKISEWCGLRERYSHYDAGFAEFILLAALSGLGLVLILRKPTKPSETN